MKAPNGYGAIVKLSGKRRSKYAVRISTGYKERFCVPNKAEYYPLAIDKYSMAYRKSKNDYVVYANDHIRDWLDSNNVQYRIEYVRQYKYLEYFEKSKDAHEYLAKMNSGDDVSEHVSITSEPSFSDVYTQFIDFKQNRKNKPTNTTLISWKTGFNGWSDVHGIRFKAITTQQLQDCVSDKADLSQATVGRMMTILRHMYKYAIANGICNVDRSKYIFIEYSKEKKFIHTPFTDDEIHFLWSDVSNEAAKIALILCYTGMRGTELLTMKKSNIFLDESYMIGGIKTENGIDRIIPLHKDIKPLISELMNRDDSDFLYQKESGDVYTLSYFCQKIWNPYMAKTGLNHYTHDGRHTLATKMENAKIDKLHRQLILGHALSDVTDKVYTHVSTEDLVKDINSIIW